MAPGMEAIAKTASPSPAAPNSAGSWALVTGLAIVARIPASVEAISPVAGIPACREQTPVPVPVPAPVYEYRAKGGKIRQLLIDADDRKVILWRPAGDGFRSHLQKPDIPGLAKLAGDVSASAKPAVHPAEI